jgi:membrane-associated protein
MLDNFLQLILGFIGTYNAKLLIALFIICAIGEFHISIPYLLETIWLLSGYYVATGEFTPFQFILLWLVSLLGRLTGAIGLFYLAYFGSTPLINLYRKYFKGNLSDKLTSNPITRSKWFRNVNLFSPFSVAMGRLFWLRIPLTLFLGARKQIRALVLGILISSVVWDAIYILLGVAGGAVALKPMSMILYSLIGLTAFYVLTFAVRRLASQFSHKDVTARP